MDKATFERERLDLFARNGFEGRSRWVPDRQGRETYLIERSDEGRPTVLVHGGLSQASEWALIAGKLPGRIVIPDRPGCGLTYPIDYTGLDYRHSAADWMLDVVDGLGAEQVDLVANSMGGYFSLVFALAHPERVHRLVLVGAPAGLDKQLPLFIKLWGNPIAGPIITKKGIKDAETLRRQVFKPLLVAHPDDIPETVLENMVHGMALPGAGRAAHTMLRSVSTLRGWRGHMMLRNEVAKLEVPTTFLWGDRDAFAPPSSGQQLVPHMPNASIEVLHDVGHLPHVDAPATVAKAITEYLTHKEMTAKGETAIANNEADNGIRAK